MREQDAYRCTIMRGGTSKAVFLKGNELPREPALRDRIILGIFGSPDVRQIDGLGGSDITTSKVSLIGPPTIDGADVDYTFGQVQLAEPSISWSANCGNISAAVGPYAIDECMVRASEPFTSVRIHNTNTGKILIAKVEVRDGMAAVDGDFALDGVPGTGAMIELDYRLTFGAATGRLLPTGNPVDFLDVPGLGRVEASIVDIANPVCFVEAGAVGARGTEARPDIVADPGLMKRLEAVRGAAALACGFVKPGENPAQASPLLPMIAFVSPAIDYRDYAGGGAIPAGGMDFAARILFNQLPVETYTGTGTVCTTVAALIEGTVVNRVCGPAAKATGAVRLGHARGVNRVEVSVDNGPSGPLVRKAVFRRTARRILDGLVYVKKNRQ